MRLFLLLLVSSFSLASVGQTTETRPVSLAPLQLKETSYDFGKIQQGRPVTHVFEIINSGIEAIRLDNVQAACGCTTPEWSREPIQPGATAAIKVGYNAAAEGPFSKNVSVIYNGNQLLSIVITGNVYKAHPTPVPLNSSISILKQSK